ncbi:MAG: universal stress protein [Alcanivorax sp.]|nr:universal stress protein [Alcanivorax sp.]
MQSVFIMLDEQLKASQPALEKGLRLARGLGAPVTIYVNGYSAALLRSIGTDESRLAGAQYAVRHAWQSRIDTLLADLVEQQDLAVQSDIVWEQDSETAMRNAIMAANPQLVVIHSDGRDRGIKGLVLTPRHWQLIRKAPCDVLCVDEVTWPDELPVLAAVDPDHDGGELLGLNATIVRQARQYSDALDSDLRLSYVVEHPDESLVLIAGEAIPSYISNPDSLREYYAGRLGELCRNAGLDEQARVLLEGRPADALAEYQQRQGPLLLVLGTVHRGPVRRMLLGSTAEKIAGSARGDLLVVKDTDFDTPWG